MRLNSSAPSRSPSRSPTRSPSRSPTRSPTRSPSPKGSARKRSSARLSASSARLTAGKSVAQDRAEKKSPTRPPPTPIERSTSPARHEHNDAPLWTLWGHMDAIQAPDEFEAIATPPLAARISPDCTLQPLRTLPSKERGACLALTLTLTPSAFAARPRCPVRVRTLRRATRAATLTTGGGGDASGGATTAC